MSQWVCLQFGVILVVMIGIIDVVYTYRREAFALLVSTEWAMREPRWVGRVTSIGSHAFFIFK